MRNESGYFKSFDDTKLFYSIEGEGKPLLFCYGLACSKLHWQYQIEYFKKTNTVIWFDYRGHHRSEMPSDRSQFTIANFVKDIDALLDEIDIPKATLLGHSMGANVVLDYYRGHPDRVEAMVLANGSVRSPLESLLKSNIFQIAFPHVYDFYTKYPDIANKLWRANGQSKLTSFIVGKLGFNTSFADSSDIETYVKQISGMDMAITLQLLKDYERYDATAWLHNVKIPTLIIAGENDLVVPKEAQEIMHQLIPNSQLQMIRKGSHCPQLDIPELINVHIERFLESQTKS